MGVQQYFVVWAGDGWVVMHNGLVSGLFSSQETAAAFAKIRATHEAVPYAIVVQGDAGEGH